MGIEEMFRDCKSGGYHLEDTGLEATRLMALLLILTIAYRAATFEGKQLRQHHLDRPIWVRASLWSESPARVEL